MGAPTFEWHPAKAAANVKTHGVSFEEAVTVFQEPSAMVHTATRLPHAIPAA
jgi:uncharacterized DUF497 family protein